MWGKECCTEKARTSRQVGETVQRLSPDTSQLHSFNSHVCVCSPCFICVQGLGSSPSPSRSSVLPKLPRLSSPLSLQASLSSQWPSVTTGCDHAGDRRNIPGNLGSSKLLERSHRQKYRENSGRGSIKRETIAFQLPFPSPFLNG